MKKLTGLLFCIAMLFSMTACGSKVNDDALDALEALLQNTLDMKSADYTMDVKMDASDTGKQNMSLHGSYNFETAKPLLSAQLDMESAEQKQEGFIKIYIDSDTIYTDMMGIAKQKQPLTAATKGQSIPTINKKNITIPKEDFKKNLKEAKLSGDTLTIVVDPAKVKDEINKAKNSLPMSAAKDAEIKELKLVFTLKDKMMTKAVINLEMSKKVDDKTETATMEFTIEFKNINKVKSVTFPDFSEYVASDSTILPGLE